MKRSLLFKVSITIICWVVVFSIGSSERSTINHASIADPCNTVNTAFQEGEELIYTAYYNWGFIWIPAGEAIFKVKEEGDQYHLSVEGKTFSSYDWFFKVRDYYDTWVDKKSVLPTISIRNIQEGKYTLYDKITFEQDAQTAFSLRGRSKEKIKERNSFNIDACMHDLLSIVFYARNLDFQYYNIDEAFPVKIFADKKTWPLEVVYKGKVPEKKVKSLGLFNTLRFQPELVEGDIFPEDAVMNVWVSDDQNKIPLLIESPLSVGSAKAVLKSYRGLKHEMVSKISD